MKLLLPMLAAALLAALVQFWPAGSIHAQGATCSTTSTAVAGFNSQGLVDHCGTLLGIKSALEGSGSALNWSASLSISQWDGIVVDGSPARVIDIDLPSKGLAGVIPPGLANLTGLQSLNLAGNQLTGEIPDLSALVELTTLTFSQNRLTGRIPAWLGDLPELCCLGLRNNQLSGPIPPELGQLTHLRLLTIRDNRLTGTIPAELGKLTNLVGLALNNNRLGYNAQGGELSQSPIPPELGCLTRLTRLILGGSNRFTGTVPRSIQLLDITNPTPRELRQGIGLRWGDGSSLCRSAIQLRLVASPAATVSEGGSIVVNVRTNRRWPEGGTVTISAAPSGPDGAVLNQDYTLSATSFNLRTDGFGIIGSFTVSTVDNSEDGPERKRFKLTASHEGIIDSTPLRVVIEDNDVSPDVRLRLSPASVDENGGVTHVTAQLSQAVGSDVTVTVDTRGCDCNMSANRQLTFTAGTIQSTGSVWIRSKNNNRHSETDPQAEVTGTTSGHPTKPVRSAVLTIVDDDQRSSVSEGPPTNIRLRLDRSMIWEDGGVARVTAQSNDRVRGQAITITVSVAANCGCELSEPAATLTIEPGSTYSSGSVTIEAVDDNERSRVRDLRVELTGDSGGRGPVRSVTLTIRDDD